MKTKADILANLPESGSRVLVVDDEPMARTLLRLMFVRAGYIVYEAEDAFDGLEQAVDILPDCVVVDRSMPGMDGDSFATWLREDPRTSHIPILMLGR